MLNLGAALPEIFMAVSALALLMLGVFAGKDKAFRTVSWLAVAVQLVAIILVVTGEGGTAFFGQFSADAFAKFCKVMILIGSATGIIMAMNFAERENMARFEFPILITLATLGMMAMVSATDMLSLYLGLELQSLALYVVAAIRRDTVRSTESGLKYFILGSIASGILLYGMSMVYGFTGTTNFATLADVLTAGNLPVGAMVGMAFIFAGLCFKVSAVPFHMWTPDVYEGAPTPVTSFFAVAPKIAGLALFIRVAIGPFGGVVEDWQQIIVLISILSMALGSFAALRQENIKRLMAYSSIGHVGFALVGLAAGTKDGVTGILVYLGIYLVMNLGTFAVILCMRRNDRMAEEITDLAGLAKTKPLMAAITAILMFSMAGIPPLAGFFGKFYVFKAAVDAGLVTLAVIGLVTSVVSAYYYLRIIKVMYFDEPVEGFDRNGTEMNVIMAVATVIILAFVFFPNLLMDSAAAAAASLFGM
ncbi:NADH-quinone oxidoreductase subunit NuoN [Thalassospira sp. FZY0004]|uniref:NADH-quinone oxidoreductase subunit N n=3 Tax=Thalassospiraceae TaxID=2844866 RepID=A0A367W4T0_9PROT|nr:MULTISPECIES: NADH-quinone oxidoreductase subunit NuoN [Thalassospira]MDG4719544.1 NADH-quinone oxidoreductase subunit NuoN [Thalassospira sp. FZY0004]RCK36413.1 NADH-quinone oxidoreductase subunit N [Thalassospira profundimaris]